MSAAPDSPVVVHLAGDVTVDWNIARNETRDGSSTSHAWIAEKRAHAHPELGGAALIGRILAAVDGLPGTPFVVDAPGISPTDVSPADRRFHHSYSIWKRYGIGSSSAWRMAEFIGVERADRSIALQGYTKARETRGALNILDDGGLGFREDASALKSIPPARWTLLKTSAPVAASALWQQLAGDNLLVVLTVDDLRRSEVHISRDLSWERTSQDLAWELVHNPRINFLARAAHVVVSFGAAGAFVLSRDTARDGSAARIVFDPVATEGSWEEAFPGGMLGLTSCLAAGIALELIEQPGNPEIDRGLERGLSALRVLHRHGYEESRSGATQRVDFPAGIVARELNNPGERFAKAFVRDPLHLRSDSSDVAWSILADRHADGVAAVARKIVLHGAVAALDGVPLGVFGKLLTADRREIESFRSIRALVREYMGKKNPKRPLNLAVFGAPGSGKSFGVIEVAQSLFPGQIRPLEFNLSQFNAPDALRDALHQVRDVGLAGQVPLVFWDEFDTPLGGQRLGWLRHFLAPMQDGRFQEGQITHPVGRAIFVFAGGTSVRMEEFGRDIGDAEFRAAKGPDFVSRLRGYVNILGPNPHSDGDPFFVLRRAVLLRGMLERDAPWIFQRDDDGRDVPDIDAGILRALLETRVYRHGARSLESLIGMSALTNRRSFERSALPATAQLDLHVDATDFMARVHQLELDGEVLDRLARAAHDVFRRTMEERGYRYDDVTDEVARTHGALRDFAELSPDDREQNRENVRDIPQKLAAAGYVMMPARSNEAPFQFPGHALELLAEAEHERWMRSKLSSGWRFGENTQRDRRLHSSLIQWSDLSESEREKDRELVRAIPEILRQAGYTVVPLNDGLEPGA